MSQVSTQLAPLLASLTGAMVGSAAATALVLAAARRWHLVDRPKERSSHCVATPTLGGLGMVAGFWVGLTMWHWLCPATDVTGQISGLIAASLLLLVFVLDDVGEPLSVLRKAAIQAAVAAAWLALGPRLDWVSVPGWGQVDLGMWSWPATALWLVALMNAYNFMDGIDGLAASEAVSAGTFAFLCLFFVGSEWAALAAVGAASAAGFLLLNAPPARIFMGDVGSQFLGFLFAVLGILGERTGMPMWVMVGILFYFVFDVTYTLVRRAIGRENLLCAHRQHLYQRLVRRGWGHARVDSAMLGVNLLSGSGVWLCLRGNVPAGASLFAVAALVVVAGVMVTARGESRDP